MPDFPAQDIDISRKLSLDPGTERLATKDEMIALIERGAQPERSAEKIETPRPSILANKPKSESSISAPRVAERPPAETTKRSGSGRALNFDEKPTSSRAVPIPENIHTGAAGEIDLVDLAAILDQHRIWVESGGDEGTKADLSGVNLENADLTGVNLQGALLQRANLRNTDLSMANLKGASLMQADLCNANLLGAELRGANLMGAQLYGAEGLWLGRLGGANLYDAMLPETISSIDGSKAVWEATRTARWFYFLMLSVSAICCLIAGNTLSARSTPAPRSSSRAAVPGIARSAAPGRFTAAATGWSALSGSSKT